MNSCLVLRFSITSCEQGSLDLSPWLYVLPAELAPFKDLLLSYGAADGFSAVQYCNVLKDMADATGACAVQGSGTVGDVSPGPQPHQQPLTELQLGQVVAVSQVRSFSSSLSHKWAFQQATTHGVGCDSVVPPLVCLPHQLNHIQQTFGSLLRSRFTQIYPIPSLCQPLPAAAERLCLTVRTARAKVRGMASSSEGHALLEGGWASERLKGSFFRRCAVTRSITHVSQRTCIKLSVELSLVPRFHTAVLHHPPNPPLFPQAFESLRGSWVLACTASHHPNPPQLTFFAHPSGVATLGSSLEFYKIIPLGLPLCAFW